VGVESNFITILDSDVIRNFGCAVNLAPDVTSCRFQAAQQTVGFVIRAGREVERLGNASASSTPEFKCPKTLIDHGPSSAVLQEPFKMTALVKGHDRAAAEIADEKLVPMFAERGWCDGNPPGRVDCPQMAAGI
jgi:hypothetical protein